MLPTINDRFSDFVAPAKSVRSGWFILLGVVLIILFYMEFMYALLFLVSLAIGNGDTVNLKFNSVMNLISSQDTPLAMVVTLSTFIGMLAAVLLTTAVLRDRSPFTLIGKGPVLRNMFFSAAILASLIMTGTIIMHLYFNMKPNLPVTTWLVWLPIALPLLFIQISAEELIFRGFLQQELAARYANPVMWLFLPSLVFGVLHWDPEGFGDNAWLIVVGTTLFGMFAADITARTGNLGAAIGLHFVNNFFALFITSIDGPMTGLSLYLTPFGADNHEQMRIMLLWDIGLVTLAYGIYLAVIHLKRRGRLHSRRANPM
jgi:membrane protease YdiL (CAAX protease family)